jgi:hypothetical protein
VRHESQISSSLSFGALEVSGWQLREIGTYIPTVSLELVAVKLQFTVFPQKQILAYGKV